MGLRKQKREIARARLTALKVGRVNKKMGIIQDGLANWRRALVDESAKKAQLINGFKAKRKLRKVNA